MHNLTMDSKKIKFLTPDRLHYEIENFTKGMAVTKGLFELFVDKCTIEDFEWNHMDQHHRLPIHSTYEKGIRIALGKDFAISLTQFSKWPIFITVSDVYVAKGLFYQSLVIGGVLFVHNIISVKEVENGILLRVDWYIASKRWFKFLHKFLDKKLYKLNARLQEEDAQIRHGRYNLRKQGYKFRSDPPDFLSSNILTQNTIYPDITGQGILDLRGCGDAPEIRKADHLEFIVKKEQDSYLIWPANCPHEGGPLQNGKFCDSQIVCPWHGLRFSAVKLSYTAPQAEKYGFKYVLGDGCIYIQRSTMAHIHDECGLMGAQAYNIDNVVVQ